MMAPESMIRAWYLSLLFDAAVVLFVEVMVV